VTRKAHLVGSIPGANAEQAMTAALDRLGPHLLTLTDGETGNRSWWIGAVLRALAGDEDVEVERSGDFSDYDHTLLYRVRAGATLDAGRLAACLPYEGAFRESFPLFKDLRERYGCPDLSFQVGLPSHLDLAVDAVGYPEGLAPELYSPCLEATAKHTRDVHVAAADSVVFQIETPASLVAVSASGVGAPNTAARMAAKLVELPAQAPSEARFGVHLCLGDMNHKSLGHIKDIGPAVFLANEIASAWPPSRPLEFIHAPFAAAEEPPTFDPAFYEPLQQLNLPPSVRFVAGCIHESLSHERQVELLRLIESQVGHEVDVAAACGLGRRPEEWQAWDAMDKARMLVEGRG
jgi:hypothetical protein